MSSPKITKRVVDAAKPRDTEYVVWDGELVGFGLRVRPSGSKSYIAVYRVGHGRAATQRKVTVGAVGHALTAEMARREAKRLLGSAASGGDPAGERARQRRQLSVAQLCDIYLAEGCATKKRSTISTDSSRIERHIKPLLGNRRVDGVTRADIEALLQDVARGKTASQRRTKARGRSIVRGGKGAATRTVGLLGGIFSFAMVRGWTEINPVKGIKRFPDRKGERFLSPPELAQLGDAFKQLDGRVNSYAIAMLRTLAFTGARKGEIQNLQWSEVDFHNRCLRLKDSKTGQKIIPLGAPVLQLLAEMCERASAEWVFPNRSEDGPFRGIEKIWAHVRKASGLSGLRIHDLRHSFASMGLAGGDALPVIGSLLGHADTKTTARYAHLSDHPLRTAADRISKAMASAMNGEDAEGAEVIPIIRKIAAS